MAAAPSAAWWRGRRVLVTGHTGFVGGWLCAWLASLGARVSGYALPAPTSPSFFALAGLEKALAVSTLGDVNDPAAVRRALADCDPQVVFHLAAQPLVREAHRAPLATFTTNALGTVHVLEACRGRAALERLVVYTTDKVYRNDESGRAFAEGDPLGGNEPYSASKVAADAAATAWWRTYFAAEASRPALAVVRAGNIVGGGDWGRERLLPDAVRAFSAGEVLVVRNPRSTRPWQHVLDVVRATLLIAERSPEPVSREAPAWNLGPPAGEVHTVAEVVDAAARAWGGGASWRHEPDASIAEAGALVLASDKALRLLGWRCAWDLERAIAASIEWYRMALEGRGDPLAFTARQVEAYLADVERRAA